MTGRPWVTASLRAHLGVGESHRVVPRVLPAMRYRAARRVSVLPCLRTGFRRDACRRRGGSGTHPGGAATAERRSAELASRSLPGHRSDRAGERGRALGPRGTRVDHPDDQRFPPASTATVATPRVTTTPPTATIASVGPVGPTQKATVVRVTDGDTIRVEIDGQEFPVRYIGMDTPEPDDPDPTVKAFADQATAANAKLVEGQEVILERDVSDTDSFDRLLRDVWVDGPAGPIHVGLELVRQGFAQVSTYPPDVRYTGALLAAQVDARANGAGLWAAAPTAEPAPTRTVVLDDRMAFVGSDARTHFEGSIGDYTWAAVAIDGDRATVRWDVQADDADCQVAWRLEPQGAEVIKSTVRVDAGQREADNRRYDVDFEDAAFFVASSCPTWAMTMQTTAPPADGGDCDDSYPGVCIPPYPPDLDCGEIAERNFAVVGSDPAWIRPRRRRHRL